MTFDSWEDDLERSGWSFGLSTQKQMLADWRTDRAEWRAALKESRQELEDAKTLLRFQEMHKSAELLKDRERLDWLLKNSHICFERMDSSIYPSCRETIDAEMQPPNEKS